MSYIDSSFSNDMNLPKDAALPCCIYLLIYCHQLQDSVPILPSLLHTIYPSSAYKGTQNILFAPFSPTSRRLHGITVPSSSSRPSYRPDSPSQSQAYHPVHQFPIGSRSSSTRPRTLSIRRISHAHSPRISNFQMSTILTTLLSPRTRSNPDRGDAAADALDSTHSGKPVSYTHLTLPTKRIV